jgi:membrane-associated phospholipid phosphatase
MRLTLAVCIALTATRALAQGPEPIQYDLKLDLAVTGAATATALLIAGPLKKDLAPPFCRICAPGSLDDSIRSALLWHDAEKAELWSDAIGYSLPIGIVAWDFLAAHAAGDSNAAWIDMLVMAEATAISLDLVMATKYLAARRRPADWYGGYTARNDPVRNHNMSFYSSHTAFAFTQVAAAGTIARLRGYPSWPAVYAIGFTLAGAVGYFRIASDNHYFTDVLTGAGIGTAVGFAVPLLFHQRDDDPAAVRLVPVPGGVALIF